MHDGHDGHDPHPGIPANTWPCTRVLRSLVAVVPLCCALSHDKFETYFVVAGMTPMLVGVQPQPAVGYYQPPVQPVQPVVYAAAPIQHAQYAQQPMVQQPMVQQPMAQQPMAQQPMAQVVYSPKPTGE